MTDLLSRRGFANGLAAASLLALQKRAQASPLQSAVDAAADAFMTESKSPGLAIGLVGSNTRRLFYYGSSHPIKKTAVDAETLFEIGSLSKTFTVALAAIAAQQGALRWGDKPSRYIPEIDGPGTDQLTLRDLATHATGDMPLQFPDEIKTWDEAAKWFRTWKPEAAPGQVRAYANPSIGLLGVVTARALGGSFVDLMGKHVLAPLGLNNTLYSVPAAMEARYAQGHTREGKPIRLASGMLAMEAYGVRTTASDLLFWVEAQLGLAKMPETIGKALQSTQVGWLKVGPMTQGLIWEWYAPPTTEKIVQEGNSTAMWAELREGQKLNPPIKPPRGTYVNKTGGTNGFGAYAVFLPGRKTGLAILANRNHDSALRIALAHRLLAALGV